MVVSPSLKFLRGGSVAEGGPASAGVGQGRTSVQFERVFLFFATVSCVCLRYQVSDTGSEATSRALPCGPSFMTTARGPQHADRPGGVMQHNAACAKTGA